MRAKRINGSSKACLLAGPLRERQEGKAPYSVRATKWSVPTAKHRHSQGHHWGRREASFLSLKRKCPPRVEGLLIFFLFYFLLLSFLSATFLCLLQALVWITTMAACSTPMENSVFKRPFSHSFILWRNKNHCIRLYCYSDLALNLPEKHCGFFIGLWVQVIGLVWPLLDFWSWYLQV